MKSEILIYRPEELSAEGLKGFFADVFATLDAHPRELEVRVDVPEGSDAAIDFGDGNPVFAVMSTANDALAASDFRRRWLPEHPVPLILKAGRTARLRFVPTDANRVKVRLMTGAQRIRFQDRR